MKVSAPAWYAYSIKSCAPPVQIATLLFCCFGAITVGFLSS
ncbi:hypothetical protein X557_04605 [Francisella tularensis subsp. holarctica PHIT-FT049]|nr:hypothetical protein X557_04605 [Francisella tularensis subsp. holarctica PHIT-FT049]